MLLLAAVRHKELPCRATLMKHLALDVGARRERWMRMREPDAVASMGGVLLLQELLRRSERFSKGAMLGEAERGRPFLEGLRGDFNLSHSGSYSVCALLLDAPSGSVGVDVEDYGTRSSAERDRIARRFFCEGELARFQANPTEREFLRIWTAKEAMVKQTGEGLSALSRQNSLEPSEKRLLSFQELPDACLTVCVPKDVCVPRELLLFEFNDIIT